MKTHPTLLLAAVLLLPLAAKAQTHSPQEPPKMVIEMRTGETHLTPTYTSRERKLARWFDLQTASISNRYQFIENAIGATTASHEQYQVTFKGRLKFDSEGKYSLNAGVFSGRSFFSGWNNSGWGTGRSTSNLYLKQLYLSAKPVRGVELQYGSLYFLRGEATEITAYDYDGYLAGQRITLTHTFLFENYERAGRLAGYGFNVYGEKKLHQRFTLGGGYAQIDRTGLNSDRFLRGKRLHLNGLVTLTPEFSLTVDLTQAVGTLPGNLPRTRLDIGVNYNLLQRLKKAELF